MFKLMIKTHNTTKFKYLCITSRDDYEKYLGLGVHWLNHLKKHGKDISTDLLYECLDYDEFVNRCNYYSELFDVAHSSEWLNIIPESGYGNDTGQPNVVLFWKHADEETKLEIISRRNKSISENHYSKKEHCSEIYSIISEKNRKNWDKMPEEERKAIIQKLNTGHKKWYESLSEDQKNEVYKRSLGEWHKNVDKGVLSEKNRKARLNTSPESAKRRKDKIRAVYDTGKHDAYFKRLSEERKGEGNPMFGKNIWKDKGAVKCPHCDKEMNDSPAARRWHFGNCASKGNQ